jgi:methylthioribose-1-phosphate isomerase
MIVTRNNFKSLWIHKNNPAVIQVIDQRYLPFQFVIKDLHTPEDVIFAISEMVVRGAPLIGVTAAFGIYLSLLKHRDSKNCDQLVLQDAARIRESRPTAVNLAFAVDKVLKAIHNIHKIDEQINISRNEAINFMQKEIQACKNIGDLGKELLKEISEKKRGEPVNILTHCNAGWLATVEYGTATAPVYIAHNEGIPVHVWVDETRPRNQGARLTAWELGEYGIPHTIIVDNAGGHLMQSGKVDIVIVGSDRTAMNGDTANKIGTYLKALAAWDNHIPFYIALPVSSIDQTLSEGLSQILIEKREEDEVHYMSGFTGENKLLKIRITPENSKAVNYGFDVTPAHYITGLITNKGICKASTEDIQQLFTIKN